MSFTKQVLRVAGFIPTSVADGPGIRSVLFLQGCQRGCSGCHNSTLQNSIGGTSMLISTLVEYVMEKCRNKKITISGGEPLEQLPALTDFIERLKELEFSVCLYTGYEASDVPHTIKQNLHYLKTGAFQIVRMYPPKAFVGSNNQNFYEVIHGKDGATWLIEI